MKIINTLRKWNLLTYQCITIINNVHCCERNSLLEIDNNRIIVGGFNELTIVNLTNNIIEQQIENDTLKDVGSLLQLRDGNILILHYGTFLCIYDINLNTLFFNNHEIHNDLVTCLININQYQFISCSIDQTIKIWEY